MYPAMLGNLAMALRHRHIYGDDHAALDEAVELHERALEAAGPTSPDRPGLLDALAGAVQLRHERDGDPEDLNRAIALGEEALDALPRRSPERAGMLAGLGATRYLRGDLDGALTAYRSALRALGRNRTVRAMIRADHAEVQAARGRHAAAGRAFRTAATEAETPVARLDVTVGWGAWALRAGQWEQAATALAGAATARRALLGAQESGTHRERWLARGPEIAAGEAYARLRLRAERPAVAALDAGRALGLAEQLEVRTIAARLRAEGRDGLADRYEAASRRFASVRGDPGQVYPTPGEDDDEQHVQPRQPHRLHRLHRQESHASLRYGRLTAT
jgi:tetratricopeptide (TPR) repeat protein